MTRVLLVDDDRSLWETLLVGLTKRGYECVGETNADGAFARVLAEDFDVVVTDVRMPGEDGIALCERIASNRPDLPVIVMTAFGSLESAVSAIRAGAYDFISKPVQLDVLTIAVDRAARTRSLSVEVKRLRTDAARGGFEDLVGQSAAMQKVYDLVARVADSEASVLVTGESGTGKEVIAHALHRRSRRAAGPFIAVNCTAMPEALLESELFGHTRGAFTDARESRIGLFAQARGGTLFLDEIGDMPLSLQPKILRALQERKIRPSARIRRRRSTCESWLPPTAISKKRSTRSGSVRTCTSASTSSRSRSLRSGRVQATSCRSRTISWKGSRAGRARR